MKKRSKRLLRAQQNLPVRRVTAHEEAIYLTSKMATRWSEGTARERRTTVLSGLKKHEFSSVLRRSLWEDQDARCFMSDPKLRAKTRRPTARPYRTFRELLWGLKGFVKASNYNRREFSYKEKNSCFFLGKGRTFNRKMLVSRHSFRHLASFGLMSGLRGF